MHRQRSGLVLERHRKDRSASRGKDGTTDQYHRFVFSVVDAMRGDRNCGGATGTVAIRPDGN
jgi:hypothetical protein